MTGTNIPYDNMSTPEKSWPLFTKCCFCIPLRTGCFIMGYFSLVVKILHTITLIGITGYFGYTTQGFEHFNIPEDYDVRNLAKLRIIERPILKRAELYLIIALLANFIWLFVNIGCLIGLHKIIKLLYTIKLIGMIEYYGYSTHGFEYFEIPEDFDDQQIANLKIVQRPVLKRIELYFAIALVVNCIWLFVNIGCLVGLHKRRAGPIRLFVSLAIFKIILSPIAVIYLMGGDSATIVIEIFIFLLSAHFILIYYVYANQMEREKQDIQSVTIEHVPNISIVNPIKLDKQNLVA